MALHDLLMRGTHAVTHGCRAASADQNLRLIEALLVAVTSFYVLSEFIFLCVERTVSNLQHTNLQHTKRRVAIVIRPRWPLWDGAPRFS